MRSRISVLVALAMLVASVPLIAASTASAGAPAYCDGRANVTPKMLTDCVTVEAVRAHQAAFQAHADAHGGIREASSPGYMASVDYVADLMIAAGYDVTVQDVPYPFFSLNGDPTFEQLTPVPTTYVDQTDFDVMRFSGAGTAEGTVTGADLSIDDPDNSTSGCEPEDFDDFPAGDIALVQRGACSFRQKADNAEAAGATGVIVFNQGNTPDREGLVFGTLGDPGVGIPVLGATFAIGQEFESGDKTARIDVDATSEDRVSKNVIADSQYGDPDNIVVAGAHLDSVPEGPGVQDNGSGSGAILEVALQLANTPTQNKVRFAWWGAEEAGLVGSDHYVFGLPEEEQQKMALYLNFDMIGSPNFARFIYDGDGSDFGLVGPPGSDAIEAFFEDFYAERGLASEPTAFSGRSDYAAFIAVGIPAGGLFTGAEGIKTPEQVALYGGVAGQQYDPCYHLACDTFDNISLDVLDTNSDAVAAAVITYAQSSESVNGAPGKGFSVGLIAGNGNPPSKDRPLVNRLRILGFDVTVIDDDALTQDAAEEHDVLIVSSSVLPTKIPAWLGGIGVPLMNSEAFVHGDLGLTDRSAEIPSNKTTVRMYPPNAGHPLSNGYTGKPAVFGAPQPLLNYGIPGAEGVVIATVDNSSQRPVIFGYESGSELADGSSAAARRVGNMLTYDAPPNVNDAGWGLFDAAVIWLYNDTLPSAGPPT